MGGAAKGCAIGCGTFLVLVFFLIGGALWFANDQYETTMDRLQREGYVKYGDLEDIAGGLTTNITHKITQPTILVARHIRIKNGSTRGIALLCETAEIEGDIKGNVHFCGRELTVHRGTVIHYDLETKPAMVLKNYGTVKGDITGYQGTVNNTPPPNYLDVKPVE